MVIICITKNSYFYPLYLLDPPKILRVTPGGGATVGVHNQSILTCSAEGNPLPKYVWLQKLPSNQVLKRGYEDKLIIDDTTYDHQGEYVCEAVNVIGDQKKIVQSEPVRMEVRGMYLLQTECLEGFEPSIISKIFESDFQIFYF